MSDQLIFVSLPTLAGSFRFDGFQNKRLRFALHVACATEPTQDTTTLTGFVYLLFLYRKRPPQEMTLKQNNIKQYGSGLHIDPDIENKTI